MRQSPSSASARVFSGCLTVTERSTAIAPAKSPLDRIFRASCRTFASLEAQTRGSKPQLTMQSRRMKLDERMGIAGNGG